MTAWRGDQKRALVFRAPAGFAAGPLAAQVGVVDLDDPLQLSTRLTGGHGLHELVFDAPGAAVAHAQVPAQLQGGDGILALADQVQGQKPRGQRQLAAGKHGTGPQTGLGTAGTALPVGLTETPEPVGIRAPAARTDEASGPAGVCEGLLAGRFGTVDVQELRQTQPRLTLNAIHGHGRGLAGTGPPPYASTVLNPETVLKIGANQDRP